MKSILEQLDEAEKAATPGPWLACGDILNGCVAISAKGVIRKDLFRSYDSPNMQSADDARLVAACRNNIRALIDIAKAAEGFVFDKNGRLLGHYKDDEIKMFNALAKLNGDNLKK